MVVQCERVFVRYEVHVSKVRILFASVFLQGRRIMSGRYYSQSVSYCASSDVLHVSGSILIVPDSRTQANSHSASFGGGDPGNHGGDGGLGGSMA